MTRRIVMTAFMLATFGSSARAAETPGDAAGQLVIHQGDHVVILGNTFAERMGLFGHFEALLSTRFGELHLTVRNMGWSADTVDSQPRSLNFGDLHTHLSRQKADLIFLCFGMSESFRGPAGLPKFELDLGDFIASLLIHKYNGESPPRLVLVSPIPHERLGGHLPDPAQHNEHLKAYTETMRSVAAGRKLPFVDLYSPLLSLMKDKTAEPLTFNGIHLTRYGDWVATQIMMNQLGLAPVQRIEIDAQSKQAKVAGVRIENVKTAGSTFTFQLTNQRLPMPPPPSGVQLHQAMAQRQPELICKNIQPGQYVLKISGKRVATADHLAWAQGVRLTDGPAMTAAEALRSAVVEKDKQFFLRWRAVNGEYIYGRRAKPFGVVNFPGEMKQLDQIVSDLDQKIWGLSKPLKTQTFEFTPIDK